MPCPVGEWVIRRACEDLKAWQAAGLAIGPVCVNLSARQFRLQDLDTRIRSLVAAAGVDPEEVLAGRPSPGLAQVVAIQAARARALVEKARAGTAPLGRSGDRPDPVA